MLRRKLRLVSLGGLLSALLVTSSMTAEGGINSWTSIGPEAGSIAALAIDPVTPGTLYASARGRVFKSVNAGGSWGADNSGLTASGVWALAIDPQTPATLYAGTGGGVFKSTNGGGSWNAINTGLTNPDVIALAIDPQTPARLYAGTGGSGVFVFDDPQTAPTIGCVATPNTIWPPNGKRVVVTVSGTVTAGSQPIPAGGTTCAVKDEYGEKSSRVAASVLDQGEVILSESR